MTNHWRDIRNSDLILINGANPAEAHPVGFQWFMRAKLERGAKMIHADPRFTRTSAVADMHLPIRTGTDAAYFGGLINHVLQNQKYHEEYVVNYTNASFLVKDGYGFTDGLFSGYDATKRSYDTSTWSYDADAVAHSASKKSDPHSWNFFGTNYGKFMVSLLKTWFGDHATADNQYAFANLPKPAKNSSWMSIYDNALQGKMKGVMLSGMTATSIGPDSNQVMKALGNLEWLVVMDPLPTTSSEFWRAPGVDPSSVKTEVFMLPTTHWIEKDGSFVNSGRWMQWKDQVIPPQGNARHDHWVLADLFGRVKKLYQQGSGKFPDPIMALTLNYKDLTNPTLDEIAQAV